MEEEEGSEKPFEASPRKLEEARKRGEVPISQELVTFAVYLAIIASAAFFGLWSLNETGLALMPYIASPERLADVIFDENGRFAHGPMTFQFVGGISPWFVAPFVMALAAAFFQGALVFSFQKIQPKGNRLSPIKNAKQKYGAEGLFNFLKSFVKLSVYCIVLALVFKSDLDAILAMPALPLQEVLTMTGELSIRFLTASAGVIFVIAIVDFSWQRAQFFKRQRMSFKELKDELKDTEGDPYTKQARRQKAYDIATNQMLSDVPSADVVVVNPEHYAVALKWKRQRGTAPVCVAKGVDEIAARIRDVATDNAVPIFRDPPTARALFASVEIGEEIAFEHYQAIASAIRFADRIRDKARYGR